MAETLGSLCDKLTIVKLKQYHSDDKERLANLQQQQELLVAEMEEFIADAVSGVLPLAKLTFRANKVYKKEGNEIQKIQGTIGQVFAKLAEANCALWHVQEHVYDFEKVPVPEKDQIAKQLAILNLERTRCIDEIDATFVRILEAKRP